MDFLRKTLDKKINLEFLTNRVTVTKLHRTFSVRHRLVRSQSSNKPLLFDHPVTSSILFKIAQHQQEAIFHHFQTSIPQFFGHKKKIFCIMPSEEQLSPTEVFDLLCHKKNTNKNERHQLC